MQSNAILCGFGRRVSDAFDASEVMAWRAVERAVAESRRFVATLDDAFQTTVQPLEQYAARVVAEHEQASRTANNDSADRPGQGCSGPQPANDASSAGEERSAA